MKMKLFGKEGSKKVLGLEEEVNAWLEQHPNITRSHPGNSASGGSMADTKLYISVWHEDA